MLDEPAPQTAKCGLPTIAIERFEIAWIDSFHNDTAFCSPRLSPRRCLLRTGISDTGKQRILGLAYELLLDNDVHLILRAYNIPRRQPYLSVESILTRV
jgi:hypothetical protein